MDERAPLSDTALDRELQAALDVDPSPEFLARVRRRIEREPASAPWWRRPDLAVVTAALLVAAGVWSVPRRDVTAVPSETAPITKAAPPLVVVDSPVDPPASRVAAARVRVAPVRTPAPPPAPVDRFPPVILAENERAALRMLEAATRIGPTEPSEITTSAERAVGARPELPPVSFDAPALGLPVFEAVSLE